MIRYLHVFPARFLQRNSVVKGATRPNSIHTSSLSVLVYVLVRFAVREGICFASLTPGIAVFFPHSAFEPALSVLVELVGDILLRDKVFDIVGLHFRDDLERVRYEGFEFTYFKSISS